MVHFWTAVCTFILGLACRLWRDPLGFEWLNNQWSSDYPALYKLRKRRPALRHGHGTA